MSKPEVLPAAGANSAEATRRNPISLLDDDDDESDETDDGGCFVSLQTERIATKTQGCKPIDDRPRKKAKIQAPEEAPEAATEAAPNKVIDGCMRNPKHPIKIFATDRDKVLRRRLRRRMASENKSNSDDNYRNHWSNFHCWTFREMLGFDRFSGLRQERPSNQKKQQAILPNAVGIDWIVITTYILDVDFLLMELPELIHIPIVVVIYQYMDESLKQADWVKEASARGHELTFLVRDPRAQPRSHTNPLDKTMEYGCHHTKMTLLGYSSGRLRVHIHTSNFRRADIHDKCQGAFLQDFFPKSQDQLDNFETSQFEETLVSYLESYGFVTPHRWNSALNSKEPLVSHLQSYDFSNAVGVLVPSVPGFHKNISLQTNSNKQLYGYLKVQQAIREHCCHKDSNKKQTLNDSLGGSSNNSIVCQFSSMGSLSRPYLNKIADAWDVKTAALPSKKSFSKKQSSLSKLTIVWPTVQEIVTSVEGPHGGCSVPGRRKNLHKDFLQRLLHKWAGGASISSKSEEEEDPHLNKKRHVPHIKSYYQRMCSNNTDENSDNNMHWFVLSSHNLSKAAWGEIQNRRDFGSGVVSEVLVIQHWELGVFVSPSTLGVDAMGPAALAPNKKVSRLCNKDESMAQDQHKHSISTSSRTVIPLPYRFKPLQYSGSDQPWVVE